MREDGPDWFLVAALPCYVLGVWMLFDGVRALVVGDYVTPRSGRYAGQLGPWASLVRRVGIEPRSLGMKVAFVLFGIGWLIGGLALVVSPPSGAAIIVLPLAIATLWYLPIGTVIALVVVAIVGSQLPL